MEGSTSTAAAKAAPQEPEGSPRGARAPPEPAAAPLKPTKPPEPQQRAQTRVCFHYCLSVLYSPAVYS